MGLGFETVYVVSAMYQVREQRSAVGAEKDRLSASLPKLLSKLGTDLALPRGAGGAKALVPHCRTEAGGVAGLPKRADGLRAGTRGRIQPSHTSALK